MRRSLRTLSWTAAAFVLALGWTTRGSAELRDAPEAGSSHAYSVEIVAELPDATETLKGVATFTAKGKDGENIKLEYRGGLNRSRKEKAAAGAGGRRPGPGGFGRRPGRPPLGPRGLFDAPTFAGLTQTTNKLTLTPQGEFVALEGTSQLPYLLGNLSLLIFEPFPAGDETAWEIKNDVGITEKNERRTFPRFGPRRPGDPAAGEKEKRTAGVELTKYKIAKTEGDLVTVEKTYALESPVVDGKGFAFDGQGTWVFDRSKSVPQKLDFRQVLTVKLNNVSVKIPITTKFQVMTEEQLAEHKKAQEKRQAEMKARLAKAQEQNQARRNAPLSAEQKAEVLKQLASDNMFDVRKGMRTLQFKNPDEPDAEISAALKKLEDHKNLGIRLQVKQIAKKWSAAKSDK